ncbi:putative nuclease HARBI1 [Daphnia magna]|uniref:putative nuclease HARBI1 n=1 Tax=Daphnia magna TaxID=35525 RepID=UPI001E1BD797|nr:putative nuclease HARBI1 [Daphnia magna]
MVLIALQFYATGTFQTVIGNVLRYSQSSVSRSITAVSLALSLISGQHIYFSDNLTMLKNDFSDIARIPGIIGCVDGTHVRLQRPTLFEKAYVNRKNYHSINVQGICDANNRFLNICATKPGSCHDSSIFKGSAVGKKFEAGHFGSGFLLGDSGYANTPFLFVPYTDLVENYKIRFNVAHKTTRCVIERSFVILKKRFHVFHSETRMTPTKVSWITVACCVLHNLALNWKMPLLDDWEVEDLDIEEDEELADLEVRPTGVTASQRETILRRQGNEKRQKVAFNTF